MHLNRIQDLKGCAVYIYIYFFNNVQDAGRGYAPVATCIHLPPPPSAHIYYTILLCYWKPQQTTSKHWKNDAMLVRLRIYF